jgi:hypothetical protein
MAIQRLAGSNGVKVQGAGLTGLVFLDQQGED